MAVMKTTDIMQLYDIYAAARTAKQLWLPTETFAPNDLGHGLYFTLIETIRPDRLEVMELMEKDGERLTPFSTPIIL